jgi:hypothetical protein
LKKTPSKVAQKNSNPLFSLTASTAQMAQTKEFMFQNVAYRPTVYRTGFAICNALCLGLIVGLRPFFLGCKIGGVRIWQGVEIFPQHAVFIAHHAVFIAQQMLDQILRICKSFLKSGFFGHIWFLLFQN